MSKLLSRLPVAALCVLAIVIPHLIFVLSRWHAIPLADGVPVGQTDPDTWLRLTLVRDWLAGGSWYDHLVHHSNAPLAPIASPWTRPVDLVLALFVYLQPSTVDLSLRLLHASLLLPVLWMALMLAGMMRAVRLIAPFPAAYVMTTLLVATELGLWNYFQLGNADHHAPLAALFVWVLVGVFTPAPSRGLMVMTGILFALQLWISVETFILIGAVYAYYGIGWLMGERPQIVALSRLSTATALASVAAIMIERPSTEWLTPVYDSISIVYVATLLLCAAVAWLLRLAPARDRRERLIVSILGGVLILAGIALTFPHIVAGPTYGVDPFILTDFLPRITEARPFYKIPLLEFAPFIVAPLSAAVVCLAPWIEPRHAFYPLRTSAMLAFFILFTTLMYYAQQRWSYYMLPVSLVALAPLLGSLFTPEHPRVATRWPAALLVGLPPNEQMRRRLPVTLALLGMPIMLMLGAAAPEMMRTTFTFFHAITPPADNQTEHRNKCYRAMRRLIRSGELDRVLPSVPQNVLMPTDLATELLFFTPHSIVASNYHREGPGIRYVWGADAITDEKTLRTYMHERRIGVVLTCPKVSPEKGSLLQAYVKGTPLPPWLKPVPYRLPPMPLLPAEPEVLPLLATVTHP